MGWLSEEAGKLYKEIKNLKISKKKAAEQAVLATAKKGPIKRKRVETLRQSQPW